MEKNESKNKIYLKIRIKTRNNFTKNYSYKLLKSYHIFFLLLIYFPILSKNNIRFNVNFDSEMTLKIRGIGNQKLFKINAEYEIYLYGNKKEYYKQENYATVNIDNGEENTIKVIFTSFEGELNYAFENLLDIIEIDLSKINTPIKNLANSFHGCSSLKFVNLSNLNTSLNNNMGHLFYNCISLVSVDLSSLDTSNVEYMDNMFYNCFSLASLNLSNFDTSKVIFIHNMFQNCTSLTSLNLSNFKLPQIDDISNMIIDCKNLQYLNLNNKDLKSSIVQNIIRNTAKNLVICIKEEIYNNLEQEYKICTNLDCSENWIEKQKKIFAYNDSCTDNCIYLYKDKCYDECPNWTHYNGINSCVNSSQPKETDINENTTIHKDINNICLIEEYFVQKCKIKFQNLSDKEIFKQNILNSIKNGSLTNLISSKVHNDSYLIINDENEIYLISTLENQIFMENIILILPNVKKF